MSVGTRTALLLGLTSALAACHGDPSQELTGPEQRTLGGTNLTALALSNTWTTKAPIPSARHDPAAATINNKIYILGVNSTGAPSRSLQVYDVASNSWSTGAALPAARASINGVSAINGRLYLTGGFDTQGIIRKSLYVYDPGANSWSRKADMPGPGFRGRQGVIAGQLYVYTIPFPDNFTAAFYRYNPATNRWTQLTAPPHDHLDDAAAGTLGGKFYLGGGRIFGESIIQEVDVYNPSTNSWTSAASLPVEQCCAASAVVKGKLYVAGGMVGNDGSTTASLQVYDPLTNTWTTKAPMSGKRLYPGGGAAGGLFYVISGARPDGSLLRKVEAYTP
jgi:N-acetylneuraminic acid mutarotase